MLTMVGIQSSKLAVEDRLVHLSAKNGQQSTPDLPTDTQ